MHNLDLITQKCLKHHVLFKVHSNFKVKQLDPSSAFKMMSSCDSSLFPKGKQQWKKTPHHKTCYSCQTKDQTDYRFNSIKHMILYKRKSMCVCLCVRSKLFKLTFHNNSILDRIILFIYICTGLYYT